ncbi:MAG TPA: hypothetical protein VKN18_04995 [Blastocatellia bacterium]|nr:hypothetical protein [Blastocatellia bacterium]
MVADRNASPAERRATVAEFAVRLFGHPMTGEQVVEETLVTFTEATVPSRVELTAALSSVLPGTLEEFRQHALARWVEVQFGVEPEEGGRLKRRVPRTLRDAAQQLASTGGNDEVISVLPG